MVQFSWAIIQGWSKAAGGDGTKEEAEGDDDDG